MIKEKKCFADSDVVVRIDPAAHVIKCNSLWFMVQSQWSASNLLSTFYLLPTVERFVTLAICTS